MSDPFQPRIEGDRDPIPRCLLDGCRGPRQAAAFPRHLTSPPPLALQRVRHSRSSCTSPTDCSEVSSMETLFHGRLQEGARRPGCAGRVPHRWARAAELGLLRSRRRCRGRRPEHASVAPRTASGKMGTLPLAIYQVEIRPWYGLSCVDGAQRGPSVSRSLFQRV